MSIGTAIPGANLTAARRAEFGATIQDLTGIKSQADRDFEASAGWLNSGVSAYNDRDKREDDDELRRRQIATRTMSAYQSIQAEIAKIDTRLGEIGRERAGLEEQLRDLVERNDVTRAGLDTEERDIRSRRDAAVADRETKAGELERTETEAERIARELKAAEAEELRCQRALIGADTTEGRRAALRDVERSGDKVADIRRRQEELRQRILDQRISIAGVDRKIAGFDKRLAEIEAERAALKGPEDEIRDQIAKLDKEEAGLRRQRARWDTTIRENYEGVIAEKGESATYGDALNNIKNVELRDKILDRQVQKAEADSNYLTEFDDMYMMDDTQYAAAYDIDPYMDPNKTTAIATGPAAIQDGQNITANVKLAEAQFNPNALGTNIVTADAGHEVTQDPSLTGQRNVIQRTPGLSATG